jgi:hypothetical protein
MAFPPTDIRILLTNYDIIAYFLNLASCSEHFISIKHRILVTFNINKKKSILTACMPLLLVFNASIVPEPPFLLDGNIGSLTCNEVTSDLRGDMWLF